MKILAIEIMDIRNRMSRRFAGRGYGLAWERILTALDNRLAMLPFYIEDEIFKRDNNA